MSKFKLAAIIILSGFLVAVAFYAAPAFARTTPTLAPTLEGTAFVVEPTGKVPLGWGSIVEGDILNEKGEVVGRFRAKVTDDNGSVTISIQFKTGIGEPRPDLPYRLVPDKPTIAIDPNYFTLPGELPQKDEDIYYKGIVYPDQKVRLAVKVSQKTASGLLIPRVNQTVNLKVNNQSVAVNTDKQGQAETVITIPFNVAELSIKAEAAGKSITRRLRISPKTNRELNLGFIITAFLHSDVLNNNPGELLDYAKQIESARTSKEISQILDRAEQDSRLAIEVKEVLRVLLKKLLAATSAGIKISSWENDKTLNASPNLRTLLFLLLPSELNQKVQQQILKGEILPAKKQFAALQKIAKTILKADLPMAEKILALKSIIVAGYFAEGNYTQAACQTDGEVRQTTINECNVLGGAVMEPGGCLATGALSTKDSADSLLQTALAQGAPQIEPYRDPQNPAERLFRQICVNYSISNANRPYIIDKYDCDDFAWLMYNYSLGALGRGDLPPAIQHVSATITSDPGSHALNDLHYRYGDEERVVYFEPQLCLFHTDEYFEQKYPIIWDSYTEEDNEDAMNFFDRETRREQRRWRKLDESLRQRLMKQLEAENVPKRSSLN